MKRFPLSRLPVAFEEFAAAVSEGDVRKSEECVAAQNHVRKIYEPFSVEEINQKIVEMLRPEGMQTPVELVFQSIEGLHRACPNHPGDWYFTGHYPTPGGIRMVNQAFVNYVEKSRRVVERKRKIDN